LAKVLLAFTPMTLLLGVSMQKRVAYLAVHPAVNIQSFPTDIKEHGMHIYGWAGERYGLYDSFPSHPRLDQALGVSVFSGNTKKYLQELQLPGQQPRYVLDRVVLGRQTFLKGYPTIQQLRDSPLYAGSALKRYHKIYAGNEGELYEYMGSQ
jgi:hypothetical protein